MTTMTQHDANALREDYIYRVNSAVQEGREDLAWELARAYDREFPQG